MSTTLDQIHSYRPQRIFLLQGSTAAYDAIVQELKEQYDTIHSLSIARFTTEHARSIASFALEGSGSDRVCVVFFSVFSPDSAQVLLKALEEPDQQTTIIFVTPYPYIVPITIRSRVMLLRTDKQSFEKFDQATVYDPTEDEEDAATRRASALAFLDHLEHKHKKDPSKTRVIYDAKHMLFDANLPTKFVMEYVVSAIR